jgi:hypothetical protein
MGTSQPNPDRVRRALKFSVREAGSQHRDFDFRRFGEETGWDSFLMDGFSDEEDPVEIAARVLDTLCVKGRFTDLRPNDARNNFVLIQAMIDFLDQLYGRCEMTRDRRTRDLVDILEYPATGVAFVDCIRLWYG